MQDLIGQCSPESKFINNVGFTRFKPFSKEINKSNIPNHQQITEKEFPLLFLTFPTCTMSK
jgi:hypothetical protein